MRLLVVTWMALAFAVPAGAEDRFALSTGFDFSSGKYGNTTSTDILYIPVTAKYMTDDLTLKVTVPYISITGPGGVTRGIGRMGRSVTRTTRTSSSGLGDVTSSLGYSVYADDALSFDLVGKVKFGTADAASGLGTGKNDYAAQIDGYYSSDDITYFATAGYMVYGVPAGTTLNNVPYGTLGASNKLNEITSVGIMLDVAKSSSTFSSDPRELTIYLTEKIDRDAKLQAGVFTGFSSGSPDFGISGMVTAYF